ncbi:MAG: C25 family peptidase propeptide domain-containing protein, partial [Acidobacteriota bacterium]
MRSKYFVFFTFILLSGVSIRASQDIKVISSDTRSLTLEFTPQYTDTSSVVISNQTFRRISFSGGEIHNPLDFGMPAVPVESFSIGVPSESGNTIQVIASEYTELQGRVAPVKKAVFKEGMISYADCISDNYGSYKTQEMVSFGEFGMARNMPVQTVNVYPVQFDAGKNLIRLYKKIIIIINFAQAKTTTPGRRLQDDDLLKGSLINYQAARNFSIAEPWKLNKAAMNSVLAQGRWFRFEAPAEGIYKITASFLKDQGLDPNSIDPKTIRVYNNSGKVLPEALSLDVPNDPVENAVYLSKAQDDGKFNGDDYILFYGRGNQFFDYDTSSHRVVRYFHPYSNSNYY